MKYWFGFLLFCLFSFSVSARQKETDSLQTYLETVTDDTSKIKILIRYSGTLINSGDYKKALDYATDALSRSEKIGYKKGETFARNNMGAIYYLQGNYPDALKNNIAALKLNEELGNKEDIAGSYANIATVYFSQGNYPDALKNNIAALKIREESGDPAYIAASYNNIGELYHLIKNDAEALKNHLASLKIKKQIGDKQGEATSYSNIGNIYFAQANKEQSPVREKYYATALENQLASLKMRQEIQDKQGIAESCINLGAIYSKLHQLPEAKKYLDNALSVSKEIGYKEAIQNSYNGLSELDSLVGDWKEAYLYHKLYSAMKDSIFNEGSNRQIVEMQTKYETEKKEQENKLLTTENEINTLEIDRQKNQRNYLIILFSLVLLLSAILFNRNRLKNKNKVLEEKDLRNKAVFKAQEDEKARLSQELHDGVGPLLSLIKLNASSLEKNTANEKMIHEIKELASEGMKEVRNISHALMPSLLDKKGLEPALKDFIEQINQTNTLKIELNFSLSSKLNADAEINIYRIIQEALNNILKHAAARTATVSIKEENRFIELKISDNGKGFNTETITNGNGLNNMYSRVDLIKAEIKIESTAGNGTSVHIKIPVNSPVHV